MRKQVFKRVKEWPPLLLLALGATAVLHFIGHQIAGQRDTADQLIERLSQQTWQSEAVRSFHTTPARAAGRERMEAYRAFWERIVQELAGDDLRKLGEPTDP